MYRIILNKLLHHNAKFLYNIILSILIFFITMEICARVDDKIKYNAPFMGQYDSSRLRAYDADGIRYNVPNSRYEKWIINELGFRGPVFPLKKPANVKRIVCLGASETFGLYETPGNEWPESLRKILDVDHRFQVINASVVGLTLGGYKKYIDKHILRISPDILVLYINPFDYCLSNEKSAKKQEIIEAKPRQKGLEYFFKRYVGSPRVSTKFKQAIKEVVPLNILKKYQNYSMQKQVNQLEKRKLGQQRPSDYVKQENLDRFENDLIVLIEYLKNKGITVITSSYPTLISTDNLDEYKEIFLDARRYTILLSLNGMIDASDRFNYIVEKVANKSDAIFIDNNKYVPKTIRYFGDNVHYTDEGANIIALNFADTLKTCCK
jgi:hypothetical protein